MASEQSYKNHNRFDPAFHFFLAPVLLLNIAAAVVWCRHHAAEHRHIAPWAVLMSIVLLVMAERFRSYALKNQDRIIRMEERLRLAALVSPGELAELDSLTVKQYVGLRFASNTELPELARRAVREKLTQKQIKQAIVAWRADYERV